MYKQILTSAPSQQRILLGRLLLTHNSVWHPPDQPDGDPHTRNWRVTLQGKWLLTGKWALQGGRASLRKRAMALSEFLLRDEPNILISRLIRLGDRFLSLGKYVSALQISQRGLAFGEQHLEPGHPYMIELLNTLSRETIDPSSWLEACLYVSSLQKDTSNA